MLPRCCSRRRKSQLPIPSCLYITSFLFLPDALLPWTRILVQNFVSCFFFFFPFFFSFNFCSQEDKDEGVTLIPLCVCSWFFGSKSKQKKAKTSESLRPECESLLIAFYYAPFSLILLPWSDVWATNNHICQRSLSKRISLHALSRLPAFLSVVPRCSALLLSMLWMDSCHSLLPATLKLNAQVHYGKFERRAFACCPDCFCQVSLRKIQIQLHIMACDRADRRWHYKPHANFNHMSHASSAEIALFIRRDGRSCPALAEPCALQWCRQQVRPKSVNINKGVWSHFESVLPSNIWTSLAAVGSFSQQQRNCVAF